MEASTSTYMKMFYPILKIVEITDLDSKTMIKTFTREIEWARRVLQKEERIVWFLRFFRLDILNNLASSGVTPFDDMLKKESMNMSVRFGKSQERIIDEADDVRNDRFKHEMEHYFGLPIISIQNYQFGNKRPGEILSELMKIQTHWRETRKGTVPDNPNAIPLIDFKNGWVWFNLNVVDCSLEANAMGHCGNRFSNDPDDTLVSLRKLRMSEGERLWEPHLTFVLNTRTGMLGEMKGRNNDKPVPVYHGMIIELLKLPIVKGIIGGGYEAWKNFMLSDLPKDVREKLVTEHPKLLTPYDKYLRNGRKMTPEILNQTTEIMESSNFVPAMVEYIPTERAFSLDRDKNMEAFLENHIKNGNTALWYLKNINGDEHLDFYHDMPDDELKDLMVSVKNDRTKIDITKYVHKTYDDIITWYEENESWFDRNDWDSIVHIIMEEDSDIKDAAKYAMWDGYVSGTEREMYDTLENFLSDLTVEVEGDVNVSFNLFVKYEDWDSTVTLMMPEDELLKFVSSGYFSEDTWNDIQGEGFKDIEQPYYGIQEYDEDYALERFSELVYEHSNVSYHDEETEMKNPIDISRRSA